MVETYKHLVVDAPHSGVAHVRLSRPPVNAVNIDMYRELASLFSNPDGLGEAVRAIVLSGDGDHFCAGNDLDEFATMTPENGAERMWRVREAFFAIQDCPVPVIGAVHGAALGTGLAIAASCDFLVATPDARLGLPELTVGVMGGARHLARLVSQPIVRRMFFTGEPMQADQIASATGAILIRPRARLIPEALVIAARIASFSPTALRFAKSVLNRIETMDLKEGYEFEQRCTVLMSGHADSKEALASFREKRSPRYRPFSTSFSPGR
jgi:enoyl-CoA hydratase